MTKQPNYLYPDGRKQAAYAVIDKHLGKYVPEMYRNYLKAMVNDQIGAMKVPGFIGQTVSSFIYYELEHRYRDMHIPDAVLVALKQDLVNALEGMNQNGVQGQEKEEG